MKKQKKIGVFVFLIVAAVAVGGIVTLAYSPKTTKLVWYLTDPGYFGVSGEDAEPYKEVQAKRFQLFNKRLKELDIPAEVVFKYAPDFSEQTEAEKKELENGGSLLDQVSKDIKFSGEIVKKIVQNDSKADIADFSPMEYKLFLPLDTYLDREEMKQTKEAFPEKVWDVTLINGKTYYIPRGNVAIEETTYCFNKLFLDKYGITLKEEKIKKMTPEEIIQWLLPYFEKNSFLDDGFYLTSANYLNFSNYFLDKKISILRGRENNLYLEVSGKKIVDGFSIKELQKSFELYQFLYKNNLDGHDNSNAYPVFTINTIPTIKELQETTTSEGDLWEEVPLGNSYITRSYGTGVLNSSKNQELAVQVLTTLLYDEELSNIMIHGVPEEDYSLENGHAIYKNERALSSMGVFSGIGNNMITYPNRLEIIDKKEKTIELLEKTPVIPYHNFIPDWNENLLEKVSELAVIYEKALFTLKSSEVPDVKAYLKEQQQKLKEAGLEEVISELQKQVDNWEK